MKSDKNDDEDPLPEDDPVYDAEDTKVIRAALKSHLLDYADRKSVRKSNINEILDTTREFMDTFVVIGYNYDGEPISCISAITQQEQDALFTLVNKFMMQHLN